MNTTRRKLLALLAVPLLAVPSAAGVYLWLEPHIGPIAAGMSAAGFEALYIGLNLLIISSAELRRYARNVALSAVGTAIVFNTLARYQAMVGGDLRASPFDLVALLLAVLESIPLAGLAYAVSVLLHRLSEDEAARRAWRSRLARRLWTLRTEARQARSERAAQAVSDAMLATARAELATTAKRLAEAEHVAANHVTTAASHSAEIASLRDQLANAQAETRIARTEAARHAQEAARLRERPAPLPPSRAQVVAYVRERMQAGASRLEVAGELGYSESTLRGWMEAANNGHAATNGHGSAAV